MSIAASMTVALEAVLCRRGRTGFQVKKHKMQASGIKYAMSPKGRCDQSFRPLRARTAAIRLSASRTMFLPRVLCCIGACRPWKRKVEAIKDQGSIELRFYGRGDLANWLRQHPGVQLWVREVLGLPLHGWRPYGRWTRTPPGVNDDLICKKGILIRPPGTEGEELAIAPGIEAIRQLVRSHEKAVRIIGLSRCWQDANCSGSVRGRCRDWCIVETPCDICGLRSVPPAIGARCHRSYRC